MLRISRRNRLSRICLRQDRQHDLMIQSSRRTPRHTTCFDDLIAALRAWAKGLLTCEAAVELLIDHRSWLVRDDFGIYVEFCCGFHGESMAAIDWPAAWAALEDGHLPCSSGERQVLRVAASIAGGVPVDLCDVVTSLDAVNSVLVARAVLAAGGHGEAAAGLAGVVSR